MGKKKPEVKPVKRTSTRPIKKKQIHEDEEIFDEPSEQRSNQDESGSDSGYQSNSANEESQEEESQSTPKIDPENYAVRNMKFRERRGTKMNYLINRKKQQEEDPFWAQQGQNYFGNLDSGDNDEEDYVQSSSGRDEFDSDFDQTQSEHEIEPVEEKQQLDQDEEKAKKRRHELMKKIHGPAPPPQVKKTAQKSDASPNKAKKATDSEKKALVTEPTSRYIHQVFNQQELLDEAATTQYFNWLSLKKLISLETEKKDFTHRSHHVEGPKVIYRNKFNAEGIRDVTYELEQVEINNVGDLSRVMRATD